MTTYRGRRRTRRLIKNWIIFTVIFVLTVSVCLYFLLQPKSNGRLDGRVKKMDISASCDIIPFMNGCAYIDKDAGELYYIDEEGYKQWGFSGVTSQMQSEAGSNRIAVYISGKLQMISNNGKLLYSKIYDYPIQSLRVSDNICAMLQVQGAKKFITVINSQGEIVDTIAQGKDETFLSFGIFSTDNKSLWLILADTSGISPIYRFVTFRYEDTKHITVSYSEYNQIIYAPVFLQNKISLLGSHEVINIDYTGKVLSRTRCVGYESKQSNYGNNSNVLLLSPVNDINGTENKVLCILDSGISYFIEEDEAIISTAVTEKYLYIFTDSYMYSYDVSSLYRVKYPLPEKISKAEINGKTCYLIGSEVYRISLK